MSTAPKRNGLTKGIRYFYGIGDMFFALMTSVGTYYSTFYLTNVAKLGIASVALLSGTVAAIDALTSWIYGAVINSTKPMKWGRYRSWLVAFTWLIPIFYFFQYFKISEKESVATAFLFFTMLGSRFVHNWPYIANVALINVVARTPDERVVMASSRATWNNLSKFAWSYLGVPFLAVLASWVGEDLSYACLAAILALGMVITYWVHFKLTDGYEDTGAEERANAVKTKRAKTGVVDLLKALFTNPPLLALVVADLAKWLFNFLVAGTVVYYFTYIALNKGMQATYTLIIAFLAVVGSYLSRYVAKKLSGRNTMIIFYLIMAAAMLAARAVYTNVWAVIVLLSIAQLGYGFVYSCSSALYGDTAIYSEWKTGKNASGWIMGLTNIPLKVGSTLKGVILPAALAVGGFSASITPADAPESMRVAIANTLLVIPAALLIVGALILLFLFRLPKSKLEQMQKEIEERKAAEMAEAAVNT